MHLSFLWVSIAHYTQIYILIYSNTW